MVEVECPKCKILIDIPKGIDTNHYDGILVCQKCGLWLDIKLVGSKVRKRKVIENKRERDVKIIFREANSKEAEGEVK